LACRERGAGDERLRGAECGLRIYRAGSDSRSPVGRSTLAPSNPQSPIRNPQSGVPVTDLRVPTPGRFGPYGGRYVPETLMAALEELERVHQAAKRDPKFWAELDALLKDYVGRPTPLTAALRPAGQG